MRLPRSYRSTFVPFIPSSSSAFLPRSLLLPPEQPMLHFPGLSSLFQCLVLGDFSSSPLLSHPFLLPALGLTLFFRKKRRNSKLCCLILSLNSFNPLHKDPKFNSLCSSPFPCFMLCGFENFLCYTELFGIATTVKCPCHTLPWLTCDGWDVFSLGEGIWAFPQPLLWLAFIDLILPLHRRASLRLIMIF